jgi:hypothetical protein
VHGPPIDEDRVADVLEFAFAGPAGQGAQRVRAAGERAAQRDRAFDLVRAIAVRRWPAGCRRTSGWPTT